MKVPFIDLKAQYLHLKESIDHGIHEVLNHGAYINGPEVKESERILAEFTGSRNCVVASSGTDALLMALMAAQINPGDEVITTPFTFIATVEAIVLLGATPVFVDIDSQTYNMDVSQIQQKITKRTKAIMPVSLYGQPADMDEINQIAQQHKLTVIEDACQSFGATYKGKKSCNLNHFGCTSFFPSKPLGCYGDGGALFTNDDSLAQRVREIREHGSAKRYHHTSLGINGRLDSIQCAVLISKMKRFPWEVERREFFGKRYSHFLKEIGEKKLTVPHHKENRSHVYAQYTIWTSQRAQLQEFLTQKEIPTAVHYPGGVHQQPAYQKWAPSYPLPQTDRAAQGVLSLPLFPDMKEEQQDSVIAAIKEFFK